MKADILLKRASHTSVSISTPATDPPRSRYGPRPMTRVHVLSLGLLSLVAVGAVAACAEGASAEVLDAKLPSEPAASEDAGATITVPSPATPDSNVDITPDAGSSDAGADPMVACASPNKCNSSTDLGPVSGDTGADVKQATGHTSKWFRVKVTEGQTQNSLFDLTPLKLSAKLTSPIGSNYDLLVYVPKDDSLECSAVTAGSTSPGTSDSASVSFGDETVDLVPLLPADDRAVTIEVRHVSGPCDPAAPWKLEVFGNK